VDATWPSPDVRAADRIPRDWGEVFQGRAVTGVGFPAVTEIVLAGAANEDAALAGDASASKAIAAQRIAAHAGSFMRNRRVRARFTRLCSFLREDDLLRPAFSRAAADSLQPRS
jgi:hypothetical protein